MKKVLLALALTALAGTAASADLGVYGGRNMGSEQNLVGVSAGQKFGKFGVQGTFDRSTTQRVDVDRYTVSGSYDIVKLGPVQTNGRVGFAYLDPQSVARDLREYRFSGFWNGHRWGNYHRGIHWFSRYTRNGDGNLWRSDHFGQQFRHQFGLLPAFGQQLVKLCIRSNAHKATLLHHSTAIVQWRKRIGL